MAIKVISKEDIPESKRRRGNTMKDMVIADVLEAMSQKIECFEFVGEYTSPNLASLAKQAINEEIERPIFDSAWKEAYKKYTGSAETDSVRKKIREELKFKKYRCVGPTHPPKGSWIKVYGTRDKEAKTSRAFCEIDYDALEKYKKEIEEYLRPSVKNNQK